VLFVAVIGWHVAGAQGLAASLIGFLGPTFVLSWAVATLTQCLAGDWRLAALRSGLVPVAIGLILATGLVTAAAAARGTATEVGVAILITLASTLFVWRSRYSPIWTLLGGGLVGLVLLR
jgi:chromate transporter